jgi:hypothetical protein
VKVVALISVLNFTDSNPYQAAIHAAQFEFLPTGRGDFRAELTTIKLRRLWMQRASETLPRIAHGAVLPQWAAIGFLTDPHQPEIRHCGTKVSCGEIIVNDRNEMHRQTTAPFRRGTMSLTPEQLAGASEAIVGRPVTFSDPPVFSKRIFAARRLPNLHSAQIEPRTMSSGGKL